MLGWRVLNIIHHQQESRQERGAGFGVSAPSVTSPQRSTLPPAAWRGGTRPPDHRQPSTALRAGRGTPVPVGHSSRPRDVRSASDALAVGRSKGPPRALSRIVSACFAIGCFQLCRVSGGRGKTQIPCLPRIPGGLEGGGWPPAVPWGVCGALLDRSPSLGSTVTWARVGLAAGSACGPALRPAGAWLPSSCGGSGPAAPRSRVLADSA